MATYASNIGDDNSVVVKPQCWKISFPFVYKYLENVRRMARIWSDTLQALPRGRAAGRVYIEKTTLEKAVLDADVGWMNETFKEFVLIEIQPEYINSLHGEHLTEEQFRAFLADAFRNATAAPGERTNPASCDTEASKEIMWYIGRCTVEELVYQQFANAQRAYANDEYTY